MDSLVVTRARYRRRYGNDMPEASIPSRFLEEIPQHLMEDLSGGRGRASNWGGYAASTTEQPSRYGHRDGDDYSSRHYSYEDEDQSARSSPVARFGAGARTSAAASRTASSGSLDNIAQFFTAKGKGGYTPRPKLEIPVASGATGFKNGERVRHPKYGDGIVFRTEGDGDSAKITVQFAKFGLKKLVEKFANLEKV